MRTGRPKLDLPEIPLYFGCDQKLVPGLHEARRLDLGLSKRTYARRLGMKQATYIKKTLGVDRVQVAKSLIEAALHLIVQLTSLPASGVKCELVELTTVVRTEVSGYYRNQPVGVGRARIKRVFVPSYTKAAWYKRGRKG
jgi:hypothetical protein